MEEGGGGAGLGEYISRYITYLSANERLSPNTTRAYAGDLEAYATWIERMGIDPFEVTHAELRRYLAQMSQARYSTATINRRLSAVRGLYEWLVSQGVVIRDAAAALPGRKAARELPRTMNEDEAERLIESCPGDDPVSLRDRAFLELLYATGARISEVSALDVKSVDLSQGQVRLFGKGSKERVVPIYALACEKVARYVRDGRPRLAAKQKGKPAPALFLSTRGNRMSADALRTVFEKHVALAGLDPAITPHAMRHTYATELLSGGADLRSVQELLGHASLSTTQIYTHLSVGRLKEAARQAHPRGE